MTKIRLVNLQQNISLAFFALRFINALVICVGTWAITNFINFMDVRAQMRTRRSTDIITPIFLLCIFTRLLVNYLLMATVIALMSAVMFNNF